MLLSKGVSRFISEWLNEFRLELKPKTQKGKCTHCGLFFHHEDLMEIDHKIPRSKGGKDSYDNLQLLHGHCHDTRTAADKVAVTIPEIDEDYLNRNPF